MSNTTQSSIPKNYELKTQTLLLKNSRSIQKINIAHLTVL